jgi:hypothetical protein
VLRERNSRDVSAVELPKMVGDAPELVQRPSSTAAVGNIFQPDPKETVVVGQAAEQGRHPDASRKVSKQPGLIQVELATWPIDAG